MTTGELARLELIIGRLEALQNYTADKAAADGLGQAKAILLRVLRGGKGRG